MENIEQLELKVVTVTPPIMLENPQITAEDSLIMLCLAADNPSVLNCSILSVSPMAPTLAGQKCLRNVG